MQPLEDPGESAIERLPNRPAVFLLFPPEGDPYLGRTNLLRRRLLRLWRLLHPRHPVARVEYCLTGSKLEASLRLYDLARAYFPERYASMLHLRMPPYIKLALGNPFPRTHISTQIGRAPARYFGPFRSRLSAERFEGQLLDLFQIRRCQEDLTPAPDHPGCMYGEMGMCLRPCQELVGLEEYGSEVNRVKEFLVTSGRSLLDPVAAARERLSVEMQFEEAARQHKRVEKIHDVLKLRDELARDIDSLHGVAVTASASPNSVELSFLRAGHWQGTRAIQFDQVSLDRKLREAAADVSATVLAIRERQDYLAIVARWFYSSWRDGEFLMFDSFDNIPFRKLVRSISRVAS